MRTVTGLVAVAVMAAMIGASVDATQEDPRRWVSQQQSVEQHSTSFDGPIGLDDTDEIASGTPVAGEREFSATCRQAVLLPKRGWVCTDDRVIASTLFSN